MIDSVSLCLETQVASLVIGRASMLTEGVVASLSKSKYNVVQRYQNVAEIDFSGFGSNSPVLCLIVQEGTYDPIKIASDLTLLREARPSARLVTVRNEKIATIQDLLSSEANGYVQGSFGPEDLIGILDLIFATPCKLFIIPLGGEVPAVGSIVEKPGSKSEQLRATQAFASSAAPSLSILSSREREILEGLGRGEPNKMMARHLAISESTVKAHVRSLLHKLKAENRTQAAMRLLGGEDPVFKNGGNGHQQSRFLD